jgi:uncharacterized protein with GYD domain
MCRFSHQISFTSSAWLNLLQNPQDPLAAIRNPVESLGGTLLDAFFTEDSFDVLALTDFPETVSPADLSIAFYAGGIVAQIRTTQLLTASEAQEAKRKSGSHSYRVIPRPHALSAAT